MSKTKQHENERRNEEAATEFEVVERTNLSDQQKENETNDSEMSSQPTKTNECCSTVE